MPSRRSLPPRSDRRSFTLQVLGGSATRQYRVCRTPLGNISDIAQRGATSLFPAKMGQQNHSYRLCAELPGERADRAHLKVTSIMSISTLEQLSADVVVEPAPARPRGRLFDPWAIAVLACVISAGWAGRPSLWFDEGATISASANRTVPELWRTVTHIDAVHGLYYLLMHGWFALFPATEFWSRVPSCVAIGAAAAGVTVFTKQFTGRTTAVCAGVVFAILPRTTWAGMEARSYAFAAAAAIWLTVLFVNAVRRNKRRLWLCYTPALMLSVLLSLNLLLLVPVHAAMLPFLTTKKSRKS